MRHCFAIGAGGAGNGALADAFTERGDDEAAN
jgi:hypothetical protein